MNYEINKPIYFTKKNKEIIKLIKSQACDVCRREFDKNYILKSLELFTDGFIILGKKAKIGKSYINKSDYFLVKCFIIFILDEFSNSIQGKIICSHKNYKGYGLKLLIETKKFILKNKITRWSIFSLPYEKLINFYEKFGFIRGIYYYSKNNELKVIEMSQTFNYLDEKYIDANESESESENSD